MSATGGSSCLGIFPTYSGVNTAASEGIGSSLTFIAPNVSITGTGVAHAVQANTGATILFNGNVDTSVGGGNNGRALVAQSGGSVITVTGNLTATRLAGGTGGAAVEAAAGSIITVHGDAILETFAAGAQGMRVNSGGTVDIAGHTSITTHADNAGGVAALMTGTAAGGGTAGSALAQFGSIEVETSGNAAHALQAQGNLNNTIVVNGAASIITTGNDSHGVYAVNGGKVLIDPAAIGGTADNNAQIVFTGGMVNVSGERTGGLYSLINDTASTGDALVTMSGGTVTGSWLTRGVVAHNQGLGDARIMMTGGGISAGTGLWAVVDNLTSSGDAVVDMTGGSINATSSFGNAVGVVAGNNGTGGASAHVSNANIFGEVNVGVSADIGNAAATGLASVVIENTTINDTGSLIFNGARVSNFGLGGAELSISGSTLTSHTAGLGAGAYLNNANNVNDLTIDITDTDISLVGGVLGVEAQQGGLGATSVTLTRTNVDIGGNGYGMMVSANNTANTSDLDIRLVDSTVSTAGVAGIAALQNSVGATNVSLQGSTVTVANAGQIALAGIYAVATNPASAAPMQIDIQNSTVQFDGTAVTALPGVTNGAIFATNLGGGGMDVTIGPGSSVLASQDGVAGLLALAGGDPAAGFTGTGDNRVEVYGTVTGGTGIGLAIDTMTEAGSHTELTIGDGAIVSAGSGLAIRNNMGNSDVVVQGTAAVAGEIRLGDGNDNLTFDGADFSQVTVADGGDDMGTADGMVDTLTFANLTGTATGANLLNWENVVVDAATLSFADGTLATGTEAGMGLFIDNGGIVDGGANFALTGNMDIGAAGTFQGNGAGAGLFTVSGNVANAGLLTLGDDEAAGDWFRIAGNYDGAGGTVALNTHLGGDGSATDMLVVDGSTSGTSLLQVLRTTGSPGALTVEGIRIVDVAGASSGQFTLVGDYQFQGSPAVVGGAYAYRLYENGVSNPTDGDWYLRSTLRPADIENPPDPGNPSEPAGPQTPLYQPGVPLYEVYAQHLLGLNELPTLQQRVGNRYWTGTGTPMTGPVSTGPDGPQRGVWARIEGTHSNVDPKRSTSGTDYDQGMFRLQGGIDGALYERAAGLLIGGITTQYTHGSTDVDSIYGAGSISSDGFSLGGTLTWYGASGFYVDSQAQASWYGSDLRSATAGRDMVSNNDGTGYALSIETGQRIGIGEGLSLTPQAQLAYSNVDFDNFSDVFDAPVSLDDGDSLRGRLGITLDWEGSWTATNGTQGHSHVYGIANLLYEFMDGTQVDVAGVDFSNESERLWGEVGLGGTYSWNEDKFAIYGEGSVATALADFGDNPVLKGTAGFRVRW